MQLLFPTGRPSHAGASVRRALSPLPYVRSYGVELQTQRVELLFNVLNQQRLSECTPLPYVRSYGIETQTHRIELLLNVLNQQRLSKREAVLQAVAEHAVVELSDL